MYWRNKCIRVISFNKAREDTQEIIPYHCEEFHLSLNLSMTLLDWFACNLKTNYTDRSRVEKVTDL